MDSAENALFFALCGEAAILRRLLATRLCRTAWRAQFGSRLVHF
jgi:hypothetical protein